MISSLFFAIVLGSLCLSEGGISESQKKQLIDSHNNFRRDIAQGKVARQPSAANMLELKWNNDAARIAQNYADRCNFAHDQSKDRVFGGYTWVGQNIAYWSSNSITDGVQMWFDEVKGYDFNSERCTDFTCLHYTALAWAKTKDFGCGAADCKNRGLGTFFLVCNYGPGGNWNNEKAYETGKACSKCPSGTRCNNNLCG